MYGNLSRSQFQRRYELICCPKVLKGLHVLLVLCGVFCLLHGSAGAQVEPTRRILILYEVGTNYPGINLLDQGIRTALDNSRYRLEVYREYMETVLFPDAGDQQQFRDFYLRRYQNRKLDLIITVGPSPLRFMAEVHRQAFPGVPIVFCMPNWVPDSPLLDSGFTGVENTRASVETIQAALRLQPGTKHIVIVGGTSSFDRLEEAYAKEHLRVFEGSFDVSYLTDLTMHDLLEKMRHLQDHTLVLLTSITQDAKGTRFIAGSEAVPLIVAAANAPVFATSDVFLNHGEVGGDVSSLRGEGELAGDLGLRVLNGEKPQDIPRVANPNTYMFDWRALKRWGMNEKNLPPGSAVLNREYTIWELYKWYIIGGVSLILAQALLIFGLLWHRARLKKVENEVRESERRFRLIANTAPVMIWMSGTDKLCTYVNQPWLDITGRDFAAEMGNGWLESIHPDDMNTCFDTYTQAFDRREPFTMQYRLRRHDGEYRWVLDTGVPRFNPDNSFAGYTGSCVDITDRKLAEEAISSVSRKLIDAQEQERSRIARELHDDINQRIAMVGIEAAILEQQLPSSAMELRSCLDELKLHLSEIGSEVQAISHRLHSSKLEYLGLVVACKSFCNEIAEHHGVTVKFTDENIPRSVPKEVSLCLFRVLQESLNNAIKYSGADRFEAHLRAISGEIQLTVCDDGIGFDAAAAIASRGLGLISMRERVSLVKGTLLIASRPGSGTEITARVPVLAKAPAQTVQGVA